MIRLVKKSESKKDKRRIVLYFIGTSLSYVAMVGGLLVFILLLIEISKQILVGIFSGYLAAAFSVLTTFLNRPLRDFGLKKLFLAGSGFFLTVSIIVFLDYFVL